MPGGWEALHVQADLGEDHVRGGWGDAADLIQFPYRCTERAYLVLDLASRPAMSALIASTRLSIRCSGNRGAR
jgi:hypothetical protein